MRSPAPNVPWVMFICLAAVCAAPGQQRRPASDAIDQGQTVKNVRSSQPAHPAPSVDGLAILSAALDSRHRVVTRHDCSHFVHDVYEQAGFHYEYASSSDLYIGVDEFRPVTNPQPGDLAVWRGHVGIVVNPAQHSFFSLLSSGPGIDSYAAPYWKQRGRPRFFRYAKSGPGVSGPLRNASWQPLARAKSEESDELVPDESEKTAPGTAAKPAQIQPEIPPSPRAIVVTAVKPQREQVSAAFLEACTNAEQSLRNRDIFDPSQTFVVFDRIEVKKVHIAGNVGWAEVQIDEPISLNGNKAQAHRHTEHQRWSLTRRDRASWELTPAPNTIYLSQSAAVRLLANQLSHLSGGNDSTDKSQQQAQLARLLNALLDK